MMNQHILNGFKSELIKLSQGEQVSYKKAVEGAIERNKREQQSQNDIAPPPYTETQIENEKKQQAADKGAEQVLNTLGTAGVLTGAATGAYLTGRTIAWGAATVRDKIIDRSAKKKINDKVSNSIAEYLEKPKIVPSTSVDPPTNKKFSINYGDINAHKTIVNNVLDNKESIINEIELPKKTPPVASAVETKAGSKFFGRAAKVITGIAGGLFVNTALSPELVAAPPSVILATNPDVYLPKFFDYQNKSKKVVQNMINKKQEEKDEINKATGIVYVNPKGPGYIPPKEPLKVGPVR